MAAVSSEKAKKAKRNHVRVTWTSGRISTTKFLRKRNFNQIDQKCVISGGQNVWKLPGERARAPGTAERQPIPCTRREHRYAAALQRRCSDEKLLRSADTKIDGRDDDSSYSS